ncbi:hypothetical protein A5662_16495 [Mycobacteriaceae bacterium 1482268.1]|nr:hypothetical protein A5662_16495 [Mycobacteriaceae bacterium 1482268.1]
MRIGMVAVAATVVAAPMSHADPGDGIAINGTYTAFSDGQWAKTQDSYHDERSVTQTWTITSSCSTYQDCTGRVVSDQGWSGDLVYMSGRWAVSRTIDNWEPCIDGTAQPGKQTFTFWKGWPDPALKGWDITLGPSGACGYNKQLNIQLPFTLTPVA